jgi:hypothetical protein
MYKIIMVVMAVIAVTALFDISDSDERDREQYLAELRAQEQKVILNNLDKLNLKAVSAFTKDWRTAYPEPTPEALQELKIIQKNIKEDASIASNYTVAYHLVNDVTCNGQVSTITSFIGTNECKPGLIIDESK